MTAPGAVPSGWDLSHIGRSWAGSALEDECPPHRHHPALTRPPIPTNRPETPAMASAIFVNTATPDPATVLNQAADLIEKVGLVNLDDGGLWWVRDCDDTRYRDGDPIDVAGALAVLCGYRDDMQRAEDEFLSLDPPHPVVAALLAALGLDDVEDLYRWTDELGLQPGDSIGAADQQAVAALRAAAAHANALA